MAHQVGIAQQHARRVLMRAKHRHRLPRLDQQRLIRLQRLQRTHNRVKTFPIPRCFPRPAINHQLFRLLRHFGIQIVQQHAQRRFLLPSFAGNLRPARRAIRPLRQSRFRRLRYRCFHEFLSPPPILAHSHIICTRASAFCRRRGLATRCIFAIISFLSSHQCTTCNGAPGLQ